MHIEHVAKMSQSADNPVLKLVRILVRAKRYVSARSDDNDTPTVPSSSSLLTRRSTGQMRISHRMHLYEISVMNGVYLGKGIIRDRPMANPRESEQ